ncbi:MAG: hypothetical protein JOZ54_02525 [Acidobacteria bacterium]|nr:hypothetical protein [Acidobacteriota bacterium]
MRKTLSLLLLAIAASLSAQEPKPVPQSVTALEQLRSHPNDGPFSWNTGTYQYDGAGNIWAIGDERFGYDKIGRLKSATVRGPDLSSMQTQSYVYDAYGNMGSMVTQDGGLTTRTVTMTVDAPTNRLTAVTYTPTTPQESVTYDGAGRVTAVNGTYYSYDALGMPNVVRLGTPTATPRIVYAYTADDERLLAFDTSGDTHWTLRGLDNKVLRDIKQNGATWSVDRDYVYRDGLLLTALKGDGSVEHYSLDHLGTPRLVTNASAVKVGYHVYWPFGEEWSPGTAQDGAPLKFTGHERDADPAGGTATLDYMHARYYRAGWGRFLTVDPQYDDNVQFRPDKWNRFSYAANDPIRYVDPNGRGAYDFIEGVANGWSSSNLGNLNRVKPRNVDYQRGQMIGDATAIVQGAYETLQGGAIAAAGGGATLATVGGSSLVTVPVAIDGLAMAIHGLAVGGIGLTNLMSAEGNGGGGGGGGDGNGNGGGNSGGDDNQNKVLSKGEIKRLEAGDVEIHQLKYEVTGDSNVARYDLYKDKKGNIFVNRKGGKGAGEPTGLNINDF